MSLLEQVEPMRVTQQSAPFPDIICFLSVDGQRAICNSLLPETHSFERLHVLATGFLSEGTGVNPTDEDWLYETHNLRHEIQILTIGLPLLSRDDLSSELRIFPHVLMNSLFVKNKEKRLAGHFQDHI